MMIFVIQFHVYTGDLSNETWSDDNSHATRIHSVQYVNSPFVQFQLVFLVTTGIPVKTFYYWFISLCVIAY